MIRETSEKETRPSSPYMSDRCGQRTKQRTNKKIKRRRMCTDREWDQRQKKTNDMRVSKENRNHTCVQR